LQAISSPYSFFAARKSLHTFFSLLVLYEIFSNHHLQFILEANLLYYDYRQSSRNSLPHRLIFIPLNSNLGNKANTSDLANYLPKTNVMFESALRVRFGIAPGIMNIDLYGGEATFYRLSLDNNSKKISFSLFDGTSLNLLFEK